MRRQRLMTGRHRAQAASCANERNLVFWRTSRKVQKVARCCHHIHLALIPGPLTAGRTRRREQPVMVPAPGTEIWWNAVALGGDRKPRAHGADVDQQRPASGQREPASPGYVRKPLSRGEKPERIRVSALRFSTGEQRARVDEIDKIQAINARISQIEKRTQARLLSCSPTFRIGLHVMDVMTEDEKNELHQLKMSLPLFGEEACAAHQRIIERIKSGQHTSADCCHARLAHVTG